MDSLVSDHSMLLSTPVSWSAGAATQTVTSSRKPGVVDIWRNLLLLSENSPQRPRDAKKTLLKHYKHRHFKTSSRERPFHVGSGISFTVDRRETVDKAKDGKPVFVAVKALKLFNGPQSGQDAGRAMDTAMKVILKELRILTHTPLQKHDNIVTLLGYCSNKTDSLDRRGSDLALVMEYSSYGTLNEFLKSSAYGEVGSLGLSTKVHFMRDVTEGLKALHGCAIAHGDMKLENALVFPHDHRTYIAKLSDFGNSLLDLNNEKQRYCGTLAMTPPELRKRNSGNVLLDASSISKCDIFSLGIMIWEILIDGYRFKAVIPGSLGLRETDDNGLVEALNGLPRDELLLQALICSHEYEEEDAALYGAVRDALLLTLCEDPETRGTAEDVVAALNGRGIAIRKDHMREPSEADRPEALPSTTPFTLDPNRQARSAYPNLRSLPLVVRNELVSLLRSKANDTTASHHDRCDATYDLAMCMISGVEPVSVSLRSGLKRLETAAELGSPDALAIVFRLYDALTCIKPSVSLQQSSHPLAVLDRDLRVGDCSTSYMSRRIIAYERLYQQQALQCDFNIIYRGQRLFVTRLGDLVPRLADCQVSYGPEELECAPCDRILGVRHQQVILLHLAARLNLQALVEYLLKPPPKKGNGCITLSYEMLSNACEGGHLEVLTWIGQRKFRIDVERSSTLFHSLIKFPIQDARRALDILTAVASHALQACDTGREYFGARLRGTALEFAIATGNILLVQMFLDLRQHVMHGDSPVTIGWTEATFQIAVSLCHWRLVPILAPIEKEFRKTRSVLADNVRCRMSQSRPTLSPFGLFDIGTLHDPTLPFIINGRSYSKSVDRTIAAVLGEGLCDINDTDPSGRTALSLALGSVSCDYTIELLRRMIARGAKFAPKENTLKILTRLLETGSERTSRAVIRLLLKNEIYKPKSGYILGRSITAGNLALTRMLLGIDSDGERLPVAFTVSDGNGKQSRSIFSGAMLAKKNNAEMMKLLLRMGANPNDDTRVPFHGEFIYPGPPLREALMTSHSDVGIINVLVEGGASLSWGDETVLTAAALRRNFWADGEHVISHLLRFKTVQALKDVEWPDYGTPLTIACHCGNYGAVYALIDAGAELGDDENVEFLCEIASGVAQDPMTIPSLRLERDLESPKMLHQWRCRMEELLIYLRKRRGLVQGRNSLHFAVEAGNLGRVLDLVEADASLVSGQDDFGRLPVHLLDDLCASNDSNGSQKLHHLVAMRSYLHDYLTEGASTSRNRSRKRLIKFAPIDSLGWGAEEVLLSGQPLLPFKRRYLFHEGFMSQKLSLSDGPIPGYPWVQTLRDDMLTIGKAHTAEQSIITTQYAQQAARDFGYDSEQGIMARLRAANSTLSNTRPLNAEKTRACLQELLSRCGASLGESHPITLSCTILLSTATCLAGNVDKAIDIQRGVVPTLQTIRGRTHAQSRNAITDLIRLLLLAERSDEAQTQTEMYLQLTQQAPDISSEGIAEAYQLIGNCHLQRGNHKSTRQEDVAKSTQWLVKAVDAFSIALKAAKHPSGAHSVQALGILLELAKAHLYMGEYRQAESFCEEIMREGTCSSRGTMSLIMTVTQRVLVSAKAQNQGGDQEISSRERLLNLVDTHSDKHMDISEDTMLGLVETYERADRYQDALPLVRQILTVRTRTLGAFHSQTIEATALVCNVYKRLGMWKDLEALQRYLLAWKDSQDSGAGDSDSTMSLVESIKDLCLMQEKLAEAEEMSRRALEMEKGLSPQGRLRRAAKMLSLADILLSRDSLHEAEELTLAALEIYERDGSSEAQGGTSHAHRNLVAILRGQNRHEDSIVHQLELLQREPERLELLLCLMDSHGQCGRLDEAKKYGSQALALYKASHDGEPSSPIVKANKLRLLASHYVNLEEYESAMRISEEALEECKLSDEPPTRLAHKTRLEVLRTLQKALEPLDMETRMYQVLTEISQLLANPP